MAGSKEAVSLAENDDLKLTEEERNELLRQERQVKAQQKETALAALVADLEEVPTIEEKLAYYTERLLPQLAKMKPVEQEKAIKQVAKVLEVSVKAIRSEIAAASDQDEKRKWFDRDGTFIPPVLANYIMEQEYPFVYDRNMLYFYDDGYYRPQGFQKIKARCLELMRNEYRDAHGNEVAKYIETSQWSANPVLDTDARFINVENGLLDWIADPPEIKTHDPDYLSSIRIPVQYDPKAECPAIDQFFRDVLPTDCIDLVYEIFGYCLLPDTRFQKAFMLLGSGANGKSVFISLLQTFIGKANCSAESLQDITENRFRVASLVGKLVNTFSDLPSKMMEDTALFKALVSGDALSAERKGEQAFEFVNHARLVFSANELPRTKDLSHGFFRRWIIIRFPNSFAEGNAKRDPAILKKLTTQEELSGLLNKCIQALVRLFSQREFTKPASVEAELMIYQSDNDNVRIFFDECCEFRIGAFAPKEDLYRKYEKWANSGNFRAISRQKFNNHIKNIFPNVKEDTNGGQRKWLNLAIVEIKTEKTG